MRTFIKLLVLSGLGSASLFLLNQCERIEKPTAPAPNEASEEVQPKTPEPKAPEIQESKPRVPSEKPRVPSETAPEPPKETPRVNTKPDPEPQKPRVPQREAASNAELEVEKFLAEWSEEFDNKDPLFSAKYVASTLDFKNRKLSSIGRYAKSRKWDDFATELLKYYKKKRDHFPYPAEINRLSENDRTMADSALEHSFKGNKNYPYADRGVQIDWDNKAVIDGKTINDKEWLFQFHRLGWWPSLARAYAATGDERYFKEWQYELIHYCQSNLPITKESPWFKRRGMETYGRCLSFAYAFPHMIKSPNFDEKTLIYALAFFHHQAEHIRTVYAHDGNHLLGEYTAVYKNSLSFREFKKAKEWEQEAIKGVPRVMDMNIYEDGMNNELVFSYHTMYTNLFHEFYQLVKEAGQAKQLPRSFTDKLTKMYDVMAHCTYPDASTPQFGDAWKRPHSLYRQYKVGFERYPDNKLLQFIATRGEDGKAPKETLFAHPDSGFYALRSGFEMDDIFMCVKNAAEGEYHNQYDNASFVLWAYGHDLMNDSGCYIYTSSDPKDQQWRDYFRSTKVHNTLTLDAENADRVPKFLFASSGKKADVLAIQNQSYKNISHTRYIFFIEEKFFAIYDVMDGKSKGEARAHFQLLPGEHKIDTENFLATTRHDRKSNLHVQAFDIDRELGMTEEDGWISYKYGQKEKRQAFAFTKEKRANKPVSFLTALVPFKTSKAPEVQLKVEDKGSRLTLYYKLGSKRTQSLQVDLKRGTTK